MNPHLDLGLLALTALIPLIIGMVWYNPRVFGKAWMTSVGMTEESMKGGNMILVFGLTYVFGFFLSVGLSFTVLHQHHLLSVIAPHPGETMSPANLDWYNNSIARFGHNYRTYRHGAFHGFLFALGGLLPVIGVNALFERRGFKYIAITWGFWAVCSVLMGAIICHWASFVYAS